jgi:arabinofuranosyltransferase
MAESDSLRRKSFETYIAWLLVLAFAVFFLSQVVLFFKYVNDDAYITFRYSRFLAMGRGPYYNLGEHVEGYTNFLFMLLLAVVIRLLGPQYAATASKAIGVFSALATVVISFLLCRHFLRRVDTLRDYAGSLAAMGAAMVCVSPAFAVNSVSGLETTLYAMFLSLGIYLGMREVEERRWRGSAAAFGAAVLTRPEASLIFAVFWLGLAALLVRREIGSGETWSTGLIRKLRSSKALELMILNGLVVVGVFSLHMLFRYFAYNGELLPNTYYAKAGGSGMEDAARYISRGILSPAFGALGVGVALVGLSVRRELRTVALPTLLAGAVGSALPFVTGTDWMPGWRLVIPYLPMVAAVVVAGWSGLFAWIPKRYGRLGIVLLAALMVVSWYRFSLMREGFFEYLRLREKGFRTGHEAVATWMLGHGAQPGQAIALIDIGIVGYTCIDQRIIDLSGLTDRHIAKSQGAFLRKEYDPGYVLAQKPAFIVLSMTARGVSYQRPPPGTEFGFWTPMESGIYDSADFQKHYVRRMARSRVQDTWLDDLAARFGAEKVFEHAYPGAYYLLAVFKRRNG